jgi:polyferredoxin
METQLQYRHRSSRLRGNSQYYRSVQKYQSNGWTSLPNWQIRHFWQNSYLLHVIFIGFTYSFDKIAPTQTREGDYRMIVQSKPIPGTSGKVKPRLHGLKALLTHQTFRRTVQIAAAAFIAFLAIQHVVIGENGPVVTASPEAFCPFGGLETLYKYLTAGGTFVSHTHLSNVVLLVAVLIVALLLRSAFCGWICPLGFLQDLVSNFSSVMQKSFPGLRRGFTSLKKHGARLAVFDRYLRYIKYLVLAWAVGGSAYFGYMVFRDYDPWSALLNIAELSFTPGMIVLVVTLIASFFIERPWCRYVCPLGAASGLLGKFSPVYLKREESACTSCKICTQACPMGLEVHTAATIKSVDCITCLECVGACPRNGALEVKFGLPLVGK